MKVYYVKDIEDFCTPKVLRELDWCFNVIRETTNEFSSEAEAKEWCYIMNSRFISRRPYAVRSFEKK